MAILQIIRIFAIVTVLLLPAVTYAAPNTVQPPVFVTPEQIATLRANPERFVALKNHCDIDLVHAPAPIADFTPPGRYVDDKGEAKYTGPLAHDGETAYREALCFRVTDNLRYAKKAEAILDAWVTTVRTLPLQGPGASDFNFFFYPYTIAADLLRADPAWDSTHFNQFLRMRVLPASEINSKAKNNIGNWAVLQWATAGAYLNDEALIKRAQARWEELLNSEVVADGSLPFEMCRTNTSHWCDGPDKGINGMHYTHWTLYPSVIAAEVFRNRGIDIYSTSAGKELNKAYIQTAAWTLHPSTFPYYMSNKGQLMGVRNAAYFAILQKRMPNADGAAVLKQDGIKMNVLELLLLYNDTQENPVLLHHRD